MEEDTFVTSCVSAAALLGLGGRWVTLGGSAREISASVTYTETSTAGFYCSKLCERSKKTTLMLHFDI